MTNEPLAELKTPKQRATMQLSVVLLQMNNSLNYVTYQRCYRENGTHYDIHGHYDMDLETAWNDFKERATQLMGYGPVTWEGYDYE